MLMLALVLLSPAEARRKVEAPTSACPAPPLNPETATSSSAGGSLGLKHTSGVGGAVSAQKSQQVTYAGTGLSQEAADQAYKVYQLCLQAEKGLIPREVYTEALRSFYGLNKATPAAPAAPPPAPAPAPVAAAAPAPAPAAAPPQRPAPPPAPAAPVEQYQVQARTSTCAPVLSGPSLVAQLGGQPGVGEALAWVENGRSGWLFASDNESEEAEVVRVWPDGRLSSAGEADVDEAMQDFEGMTEGDVFFPTVEGTLWGDSLLDTLGWRVVGSDGVVVALQGSRVADLSAHFGGPAPARLFQLPIGDETGHRALMLSVDPASGGAVQLRSWWLDLACLG